METLIETIMVLGVKRFDAQVYVFLAKKGPHKCSDMCRGIQKSKQRLYPSLKILMAVGIVKSTNERPAIFYALPIEKTIEIFVAQKLSEIKQLESSKKQITKC
jgi:sugar-specific transcriptional regulator TrmB